MGMQLNIRGPEAIRLAREPSQASRSSISATVLPAEAEELGFLADREFGREPLLYNGGNFVLTDIVSAV
jgi:hypothetical protein